MQPYASSDLMELPHESRVLPRPSLSSFNLFLLHIFLPTSLAEDNKLTLARYYIPSLTHLRNPHASQGYLLLTANSLEGSSILYSPPLYTS